MDPSALVKQIPLNKKYANVTAGDGVTGNGVIQNGPYNPNNYLNNANTKKVLSEAEISC